MATRREMIESQRPGQQNIDTGTVIGPKAALEHRQNVIQNNQTIYQQNLANPINLPKQPDNTRSMISNIMQLGKRDAAKGAQALDLFGQLQMDSTSPFYAPYSKPTNQAVGQMSELLGQDVGEVNSDWLNRNSWMKGYYKTSTTTNTPTSPGKKGTQEEWAGYYYYQLWKAEETTQKAEAERAALQQELTYWANQTDRNYSDEKILSQIDWKKYPTLQKMNESREAGAPMELNRAIDWNGEDSLYGMLWAARNGSTGNPYLDMANSYDGVGNVWQENPEISAKLDIGNKATYAPYSVGSTMDAERSYFGVSSFDQQWIDENRDKYLGSGDATAAKFYANVVEAEEYTQKLEEQRGKMDSHISTLLRYYDDPEKILKALQDSSDYKDLFALDKSLETGKLKDTTRAVDYRWQDVEAYVRAECGKKKPSVVDIASEAGATTTQPQQPAGQVVQVQEPGEGEVDAISGAAPKAPATPATTAPAPTTTPAPVTPTPTSSLPTPTPAPKDLLGRYGKGNINLYNRPKYVQEDGSVSTVNSISFYDEDEQKEILVPTIVNGQQVSEDEAIQHYYDTGEYLGKFENWREADEYAEELHQQQEMLYGQEPEEAPAPTSEPVTTPGPVTTPAPVLTESEKALEAQAVENLNTVAPVILESGTEAEKVVLETGKTGLFDWAADQIRNSTRDVTEWFRSSTRKAVINGYIGAAGTVYDYEKHQRSRDDLQVRLDGIMPEWQGLNDRATQSEAVGSMTPEEFDMMQWLLSTEAENSDDEWSLIKKQLTADSSNRDALGGLYLRVAGEPIQAGSPDQYAAKLKQAQLWWDAMAKDLSGISFLTDEEQARLDDLTAQKDALEGRLSAEDEYLHTNEQAYKDAQVERDRLMTAYAASSELGRILGKEDSENLLQVLDYAYALGSEPVSERYLPDNAYDMQVADKSMTRETATQQAAADAVQSANLVLQLDDLLKQLDESGVELPEGMRDRIQAQTDRLRENTQAAGYVMLDGVPDFAVTAKNGKDRAARGDYGRMAQIIATGEIRDVTGWGDLTGNAHIPTMSEVDEIRGKLRVLTEEEKNRFYYLLETGGGEAASRYWDLLNKAGGVLQVRRSQDLQQDLYDFASENVLTGTVATLMSFLTNLHGGAQAVGYMIDQKLFGGEFDPFDSSFDDMLATGSLRGGVKDQINRAFGEGTAGAQAANMFFDGFTSSGDSLINAQMMQGLTAVAGTFFSGTALAGVLQSMGSVIGQSKVGSFVLKAGADLGHASSMGLNAAVSSYRDTYVKTNSTEKALKMAVATFFAETGSEAITVGNLHEAFGSGAGVEEAKSLLVEFFKNGGEEFLGEGANEWVSQNAERLILGADSEYQQTLDKYLAMNIPEEAARAMADQDMWKNVLMAAATGFISSGFGTAVEYVRGRMSGTEGGTPTAPTEPAVTTEETVTEETPAVTEQSVTTQDTVTTEPAVTEEAPTAFAEQLSKDLAALTSSSDATATSAAVGISAVLDTGDTNADKATAQGLTSTYAGGDTKLATNVMQQILLAAPADTAPVKLALTQAVLGGRESQQTLRGMFDNVKAGGTITAADVTRLMSDVQADMAADPQGFQKKYESALKESRIANRTAEILETGEDAQAVRTAEKAVDQAKESVATAQETLENAQADVTTATDNLSTAVEQQQANPADASLVAPVQQAAEQVEAAVINQQTQEKAVADAQSNLEDSKKERTRVGQEALNKARSRAASEVGQQMQQEAQAAYDQAVATLAPTVPFGRSFTAVTRGQRTPVKLTGVYDIVDNGSTIVYTTENGLLATTDFVDSYGMPKDLLAAEDLFEENPRKYRPASKPAFYFPSGFMANVNGQQVQMIGLAGKVEAEDGYIDPVLMDINGGLYVGPDISPEANDIVMDLFEAQEDNLQLLKDIPQATQNTVAEGVETNAETATTEEGAPTDPGELGSERNQSGELAAAPGRDDGRGDNIPVEPGAGVEPVERGTESQTGYIRPDQSRVPARLLKFKTRNVLKRKGVTDLKMKQETDPQRFSSLLEIARENNSHKLFVDSQSVEELTEKGAIMLTSNNGLAMAAVGTQGNQNGNIFAVCKSPRSKARGASAHLIIQAIAQGGNKLDCYDGALSSMYAKVGMIPVARVAWNDAYHENDGWNYERDGRPDIVFWIHNGDSAETVAEKYKLAESEGGYHIPTSEEIAALPLFDDVVNAENKTEYGYDRAWAYRDSLLEQRFAVQEQPAQVQALRGTPAQPATPTQQQVQKVQQKLESPQRIAQNLIEKLGFGNFIGSNRFGKYWQTRGFYDPHGKYVVAKAREAGENRVTGHEIGHAIADRLKIRGSQDMVDNLMQSDPDFWGQYKPQELANEAMAEFMWQYLENEQAARAFAGDVFYDDFESRLRNTDMWDAVQEAKEQMTAFRNADTDAKIQSVIRYDRGGTRKSVKDITRAAIAQFVDRTAAAEPIEHFVREMTGKTDVDLDMSVRKNALLAGHSQKRVTQILVDNLIDPEGNIIGDGWGKRMQAAGFVHTEENLQALERYALALHSLDRIKQNKPVFGEWASEQAIQDYINKIQSTRPDIVKAEKVWQDFRTEFLQAWMVDTGFWKQDFLDELNVTYPHYVPTFRVKDNEGVSQSFNKNGAKRYIMHEATGSSQDIYSPFASFVGMVDSMVTQVENNRVAQVFDRLYQQYEGLGEAVGARQILGSELDSSFAPEPGKLNAKQEQLADLLKNLVGDDIISKALEITASKPGINQTDDAALLTVHREDGTTVQYEVQNPELFSLLAGVNKTIGKDALSKAISTVGALTRTMSMLTTGSNPLFAARNAVRDYQTSVNSGTWASNYLTGIPKWLRSFYEVWRGSEDYENYKALGGGGWTRVNQNNQRGIQSMANEMFGDDVSSIGKKGRLAGKKLWNLITLDAVNGYIEQASRFAEYKFGKHDLSTSKGRQEAFLAGQEVSVDFSRSGNSAMASTMKKLIPFFNASMQGVYRSGRQLTEGERSRAGIRAAKNIINTGLMSALASGLILKFMGDDEKDEFANMLSDGLKSNHLMLPNPLYVADEESGQPPFLRVPLAQDPLTYAVHGAVTDAIWKGTEDETAISLAAIADTILDNLNPVGSGTVFQPWVDASHNRTWYGSAIVRTAMKDWTDASGQFNEDTPMAFRWLGNLLSTSPEIVEYIMGQYTGFLGSTLTPMLTFDKTGELGGFGALVNSVTKKWTADPTSSNDITGAFYDAASDITTIQGEAKQGRPQGLLLRSLTQDQVNAAYEEANEMLKSGGVIYDTKKIISDAYAKIDKINANATLDDSQKAYLAQQERRKMLEAVGNANRQIQAYYKKYITGESLVDQTVGQLMKRFVTGDVAVAKTAEEKLPQAFQDDANSPYMQKALSIFQNEKSPGYQREAALPHPSKEFETRDPVTKNKIKRTIPDDEWEAYTAIYRDAYSAYLDSKIVDWDLGDDARKYEILKGAHAAANKKMKDAYLATHAPAETAAPEESDEEDHTSGGIRKPLGLIASNGASDLGFSGSPKKAPVRPASDDDWGQYMKDLDDYWLNYDFGRDDPTERNYTGTIDINNRKVVHNPDGSISTDYSFSIYDENAGKEVLIPQVVDGKIVSQDEAIEHYYKTGEHFGMFDDWHDADEYAMMLHNRNYWYYR